MILLSPDDATFSTLRVLYSRMHLQGAEPPLSWENFSDYCKNFLDSGIRIPLHEATYKWGDLNLKRMFTVLG